jgi:hypothetical protein
VPEITIHETTDATGAPVRTRLLLDEGALSLDVGSVLLPLPDGALEAVMKRYGKALDAPESEMMVDERLELGEGSYLVLYRPNEEPLCEMATSITAALDHLARRFASVTQSP